MSTTGSAQDHFLDESHMIQLSTNPKNWSVRFHPVPHALFCFRCITHSHSLTVSPHPYFCRRWEQVRLWLIKRNLREFIEVFDIEMGDHQKIGIEGTELLEMDMNRLFEDPFHAGGVLDIEMDERNGHPLIDRFFRYCPRLNVHSVTDCVTLIHSEN